MVVESRLKLLRPVGVVCREVPACSHASSITTFRILSQFGIRFCPKERNTRKDATQWNVGKIFRILKLLNLFSRNSRSVIMRIRDSMVTRTPGKTAGTIAKRARIYLSTPQAINMLMIISEYTRCLEQTTLYLVQSHFGARLSGIAHLAWREACTAS